MLSVIDWLRESAKFMADDRPDIYNFESALYDLSDAVEQLRTLDNGYITNTFLFTSYSLIRIADAEGVEEFILSRKLSSVTLFTPEDDCLVLSHTDKISLPKVDDDYDDVLE